MKREKLLARFLASASGHRPAELKALLIAFEFHFEEGARHTKFYYKGRKDVFMTLPRHANELAPAYVRQALGLLYELGLVNPGSGDPK